MAKTNYNDIIWSLDDARRYMIACQNRINSTLSGLGEQNVKNSLERIVTLLNALENASENVRIRRCRRLNLYCIMTLVSFEINVQAIS